MKRKKFVFAFVVVVAVVYGHDARAQADGIDSTRTAAANAALASFQLDSRILLVTVGHSTLEGRLAARSDTDVVVMQHDARAYASVARIAEIWREGRDFKSGAIAGGLGGGILFGLTFGLLAEGLCDSPHCHGAFAQGLAIGALAGGSAGALIGAAAGGLAHRWVRVWP